jgi:hypothetical protein
MGALVAWLGLALVGSVRQLADLRDRVARLEASVGPVALRDGLPVGATAPGWTLDTPAGEAIGSGAFDGRRHLVVFADRDCEACDALMPELVRAAARGDVPPVVVVGRGVAAATPGPWRDDASTGRVVVGTERGAEVSDAYLVDVSPHVFVVDEGGYIVGQGGATGLADVRVLVRDAEGITIVGGPAGG